MKLQDMTFKFKLIISGESLKLSIMEDSETAEPMKFKKTLNSAEIKYFVDLKIYLDSNKYEIGNVNYFTLGDKFIQDSISESDSRSDAGSSSPENNKAKSAEDLANMKIISVSDISFDPDTFVNENLDLKFVGCIHELVMNHYAFDLHGHEYLEGCSCYNCYLW